MQLKTRCHPSDPISQRLAGEPLTRRGFVAGLAAAPLIVAGGARAAAPANSQITVGVVGLGSRGFNLLDDLLKQHDVHIAALCDVDEFHYRDRAWGSGRAYGRRAAREHILKARKRAKSGASERSTLDVTDDFREVCGREDIDAVVVATPDHWHALCALAALRNGKDVYCEKPVTHTFYEGVQVHREVAQRKAVFQTGSQQRSDPLFRRAVELVWNGHLGALQRIRVGLPPGYDKPQGDPLVAEPPKHLDYDRWCGPAAKLPYMRARHHRWWRGHTAYGGGVLMDWIGHHNDIAHWAMKLDRSGPAKVEAVGWSPAGTDVYDTPHQYGIACQYAGGVQSLISSSSPLGARFEGDEGWVFVTRGKIQASNMEWAKPDFDVGKERAFASPGHLRNFLDCMRSRSECVAPAEVAHRSITPGHLAYVSNALGRPLHWDAAREQVQDDDEANKRLVSHSYRGPWKL